MNEIINFHHGYDTLGDAIRKTGVDKFLITDNKYMPFYAGFYNQVYTRGDESKLVSYYDFTPSNVSSFYRRYESLIECLNSGNIPIYFMFNGARFLACRGAIKKVIIIKDPLTFNESYQYKNYMLLVIEKDYYWKVDEGNIDYSQFKLLISNEFFADQEIKVFAKRIEKEYISILKPLGVDIIYTNNIDKYCFNKFTINKSFKTMKDMRDFLSSINDIVYDRLGDNNDRGQNQISERNSSWEEEGITSNRF